MTLEDGRPLKPERWLRVEESWIGSLAGRCRPKMDKARSRAGPHYYDRYPTLFSTFFFGCERYRSQVSGSLVEVMTMSGLDVDYERDPSAQSRRVAHRPTQRSCNDEGLGLHGWCM